MDHRFDSDVQRLLADTTAQDSPEPDLAIDPMPMRNSSVAHQAQAARAGRANVQRSADGEEVVTDDADVQHVASFGAAGQGQPLPHLDTIQRSFGKHNVSGIRAHAGGQAHEAGKRMGAQAYARGSDVVFRDGNPGLHLAAHEAAHVVQQRGGVQLKGGVGAEGDVYERHADDVADKVVAGESAEALLDQHAGPGNAPSGGTAVQARFDTMRQNLINASHNREHNASYVNILAGLQEGINLQAVAPPTVRLCDQMLQKITAIQALIAGAASTKRGRTGRDRNAALDALGVHLGNEHQMVNTRRDQLRIQGAMAVSGGFGHVPSMQSTGGDQGASGSYFDRQGHGPVRGIFKPESQEGGARAGRDARGSGAVREVVGHSVDQRLHLGVVPNTRMLAVDSDQFAPGGHPDIAGSGDPLQVGSYQQGVGNLDNNKDITSYMGDDQAQRNFDANSLQKIAILDMLTLNRDRHGENVMIQQDGRLVAIDQGEIAPNAVPLVQKFNSGTVESAWAWADLPESEQAWTVANRQIIAHMDVEAEVDAMAQTAQQQSALMTAVTGEDPAQTHLSASQTAMMKYSGRALQLLVAAGLSPAQCETVFKKRDGGRDETQVNHHAKKTAKRAGGGEFIGFVRQTFQQDDIAVQIAKQTHAPIPAPQWAYGAAATEDKFNEAMAKALSRFSEQRPELRATIGQAMSVHMAPPPGAPAGPPVTNASAVNAARRLWAHIPTNGSAVGTRGHDEKVVMDRLWQSGSSNTRDRILSVLNTNAGQLRMSKLHYILEAVDPQHRMNLPSKLADWYEGDGNDTDFWTWLAQGDNAPEGGHAADYLDDGGRAACKVRIAGGRLQQGAVAAADMNTGGGDGNTVVLSGGDFYSKPKGGPDDAKTQHSSFMAGVPVDAAAMMRVNGGTLEFMNNYSGHYAPTINSMVRILIRWMALGVPLGNVQVKDNHGLALQEPRMGNFAATEYLALARRHL